MRRLALVAVTLLAGCGGDDSATTSTSSDRRPDAPNAYVSKMQPIVGDVGRALRGADPGRRRDFDRGVALLRARRQMARITADPALLLAHDRLSRSLGRGGTLLVSEPGSPYARAARRAGTPLGARGAIADIAPAVSQWAFEVAEKFRASAARVPSWVVVEKRSAERLIRRVS